ncbi:MAG: hypothetical protein A2902_06185 [Elusimicrobia bacterium RIFCSPLOWO2_01_FULL_64_13]|nr:MAG: hypothetical protein A2636_06455 [Elusimicrobia bacterium RIFCSPHIGHO2_01_FULL_64_10]OGR96461.1 MAG: hypothetical protein A2902_06185 [Elusimicrobia bacterium RIFCSPLOWO2_01_FULL_64_13]
MTILEKILADKRKRVEALRGAEPYEAMLRRAGDSPAAASLLRSIRVPGKLSVIAEMKRKSPSAGTILDHYDPSRLARDYESCGARGISVLTEEDHFGGAPRDLELVRKASSLPVLRKDFIIDPIQVPESKLLGASAALLIIAALTRKGYAALLRLCREIELEALVEVHDERELEIALAESPDMIGVNNRDLKDLSVDVAATFRLAGLIPKGVCAVSESGIADPETVRDLKRAGVSAALIGESVLRSPDPSGTLRRLVEAGE